MSMRNRFKNDISNRRNKMERIREQFMLGETEVIICDDQCVSEEDTQKILKELAQKMKFCTIKKES